MDCRVKPGNYHLYEASMTAYLISLALIGLVAIAAWEALV